ncbi:MAG: NAD(P)H-hydrate dehydratase [Acidobacteria bacterium]|nr:NAD(P)H-hydrate dehydratase [Acidobacteriota bacterium]
MIPVLTPDEVRAVDEAAPEPVAVLIGRAGAAVARSALELLGGGYGRRVVVIAGKGNNGADGREAARLLRRRGVRVEVVDATDAAAVLPSCDLVIDAAYGTGFRGSWNAPSTDAPVLAVDIPSGVDAGTGDACDGVLHAVRTVTFAALKPGLLFGAGARLAGEIDLADIGLDVSRATAHVVEHLDVAAWLPARRPDSHKWKAAAWVVAGSAGMTGAATLATRGAQRAGAGYVRLSSPGAVTDAPVEAVAVDLPGVGWADEVLADVGRFKAMVVGPGLGRASDDDIRRLAADCPLPMVLDGDALTALAAAPPGFWAETLARRAQLPTTRGAARVLTPHDGEYARLAGEPPGPDRIDAARRLAAATGCTVLLKGSTTVVAEPDGSALLATQGDARLATAGTGDVLAGIIGALLAQGMAPARAAAAGAWLHGAAARVGPSRGLVAGDLPDCLPLVFDRLGV